MLSLSHEAYQCFSLSSFQWNIFLYLGLYKRTLIAELDAYPGGAGVHERPIFTVAGVHEPGTREKIKLSIFSCVPWRLYICCRGTRACVAPQFANPVASPVRNLPQFESIYTFPPFFLSQSSQIWCGEKTFPDKISIDIYGRDIGNDFCQFSFLIS